MGALALDHGNSAIDNVNAQGIRLSSPLRVCIGSGSGFAVPLSLRIGMRVIVARIARNSSSSGFLPE
jgi:hypothetical protein